MGGGWSDTHWGPLLMYSHDNTNVSFCITVLCVAGLLWNPNGSDLVFVCVCMCASQTFLYVLYVENIRDIILMLGPHSFVYIVLNIKGDILCPYLYNFLRY